MYLRELFNRKIHFSWLVIILFSLVYSFSLTFYYVEGDDAATIIFHALGRNKELQKPYEPYHSGMDYILSALPANEPILRITAIGLSALAEVIMVIFMISLALRWLKIDSHSNLAIFSVFVILAAIPELFFAGLYMNPTAIAMFIIMVSHFLLLRYFNGKGHWWLLLIAVIIFGFGATIRWNTVLYGLIIVTDILWLSGEFNFKKLYAIVLWGISSLFFFFIFLYIQGYTPASIIEVYNFKNHIIDVNSKISPMLVYIQSSTFYTPAMLLISFTGFIFLFISDKKIFLFTLLALGLMILLFQSIFFKMMVTVFPVFFMLIIAGIKGTESLIKSVKISRSLLFIACASPWLIGIKVYNSKIWGPGFELKEKYYSPPNYNDSEAKTSKYNFRPVLFDGCGYPSPEGPRPMGGYAGILIGGKWRNFFLNDQKEYQHMINLSIGKKIPLVKIEYNYVLETLLLSHGFKTVDPYNKRIFPDLTKRRYFNHSSDTVTIYHIENQVSIRDSSLVEFISRDSGNKDAIIFSGHYGKPLKLISIK